MSWAGGFGTIVPAAGEPLRPWSPEASSICGRAQARDLGSRVGLQRLEMVLEVPCKELFSDCTQRGQKEHKPKGSYCLCAVAPFSEARQQCAQVCWEGGRKR